MSARRIIVGDCREQLALLDECSVDAVVTDPPAGIGFMGKVWDSNKGGRDAWVKWLTSVMVEVYRVLKPGGHALVWAIPRTSHWAGWACEDAGFEMRDRLSHLFGSGFPKSLNVSKAIDEADGLKAQREVVSTYTAGGNAGVPTADKGGTYGVGVGTAPPVELAITRGASERSRQWDGWGTALKPACEDWWLIRRPMSGTVAANVLEHGTGALNVDGTRVGDEARFNAAVGNKPGGAAYQMSVTGMPDVDGGACVGRWPANVVLDEEAAALLDEQSGVRRGGERPARAFGSIGYHGGTDGWDGRERIVLDSGGASRFFYCAKTSAAEREAGLEGFPKHGAAELTDREPDTAGLSSPRAGAGRTSKGRANVHPTVKPIALMRWLCRLITPPGGLILDPFTGSGSTGCAAVAEGFRFIGIEQDAQYAKIAEARIAYWAGKFGPRPPPEQVELFR